MGNKETSAKKTETWATGALPTCAGVILCPNDPTKVHPSTFSYGLSAKGQNNTASSCVLSEHRYSF